MTEVYDGMEEIMTRFGPLADWQERGIKLKPDFTEGIDYFGIGGNGSIWGEGNQQVLDFFRFADLKGTWVDLGSGDGRYTPYLLEKADRVVATDIDSRALDKLRANTAPAYLSKLETKEHDITTEFPFDKDSLDGIFSAGILHLFQKEKLVPVAREIYRTLMPGGEFVLDFPTNMVRMQPDHELLYYADEPRYTLEEAKEHLGELFNNGRYSIELSVSHHSDPEGTFRKSEHQYHLECDYLLFRARKI